MTLVDQRHQATKRRMLSLIAEFASPSDLTALVNQATDALGKFDFEARMHEEVIARVAFGIDEIVFDTHHGISGKLYPQFELDTNSLRSSATGQLIDIAGALRLLRVSFRLASDVRIIEQRDGEDEETFVVDPDLSEKLTFEHQT
jgi:hypothetical protein